MLIAAEKKPAMQRERAEVEAVRIIGKHWFCDENKSTTCESNVREKIWNILVDIVACMAYCRKEEKFFHRSVYRHAQALLWAPNLNDTDHTILEGSLAQITPSRREQLNLTNTSCALSAESVMKALFEKKR